MSKYSIPPSIGLMGLETRIADVFSIIIHSRMTAEAAHALVMERIVEPINARTPKGRRRHSVWLAGYASGIIARRWSEIWQFHVEFCYVKDGVQFSTHRGSSMRSTEEFYAAGRGCELADLPCAHFWKGTDRPYTQLRRINNGKP